MKDFFSSSHFKESRLILVLLFLLALIGISVLYQQGIRVNYFHAGALILSLAIWTISSMIDKQKYFNVFSLLTTTGFCYMIFWFAFRFITI